MWEVIVFVGDNCLQFFCFEESHQSQKLLVVISQRSILIDTKGPNLQ